MNAKAWRLALSAAALMAIVSGGRSASGLFLSPLNTASGVGLAGLSFALALGQLLVGLAQPVAGAMADRFGAARVIVFGAWIMAATTALPSAWALPWIVSLSLVASAVAGSAVASNGLLVGEVGRGVPAERTGVALGLVGAGASVGQLLIAPAAQWAIGRFGWSDALLGVAALSLVALPLSTTFRRPRAAADATRPAPQSQASQPVKAVLRQWSFWRVAGSFAVCGFHVAFLAVHMPGVIERCGLPASLAGTWIALAGAANIAGSIAIGFAMKRRDSGVLLVGLYGVRAAGIAALLLLPTSTTVMLCFALVMGASHMATLPPTSQLVARQFGPRHMGTLFGVVMLVHQVGSFAGIWLGGWAAAATGSDTLLWVVDITLALVAGMLVWPRVMRRNPAPTFQPSALGEPALAASRT